MVIEKVTPEIEGGRFPIKRVLGERVVVEANIFADGHDSLAAVLKFRAEENPAWSETPMELLANDRWRCDFFTTELGDIFTRLKHGWITSSHGKRACKRNFKPSRMSPSRFRQAHN